jgi:hypothetical protein
MSSINAFVALTMSSPFSIDAPSSDTTWISSMMPFFVAPRISATSTRGDGPSGSSSLEDSITSMPGSVAVPVTAPLSASHSVACFACAASASFSTVVAPIPRAG